MRLVILYCLLLIGPIVPVAGQSNDANQLLDSAAHFFEQEKMEEAREIYRSLAYNPAASSDHRLKGFTGLVTVAVFMVEFGKADSLIVETEQFLSEVSDPPSHSHLLHFRQKKGEYLRQAGKYEDALEIHLEVNAAAQQLSPPDSHLLAMSYIYVAASYEDLSQYGSALEFGQTGYQLCNEYFGSMDMKLVSPNTILAVIYYRESIFDSAFVYYERAINILNENLKKPSAQLAVLYGNIGATYNDYGDSETAIEKFEKAIAINTALNNKEGLGYNLYGIGTSYFFLGDYGRAIDYMNACLAIRKQVYPPDHYLLTSPKEVLGIAEYESGDYAVGLAKMVLVKNVRTASFGAQSLPVAFTNENIAVSFNDVGLYDSAMVYMQEAVEVYQKVLPENHANLGHSNFNLAKINENNGRHAEALIAINTSNDIYEALNTESDHHEAQNNTLKGEILTSLKQYDAAEQSYQIAFHHLAGTSFENVTDEDLKTSMVTLDLLNSYQGFIYRTRKGRSNSFDADYSKLSTLIFNQSDKLRRQFNDPYTKGILMRKGSSAIQSGISTNYQLYREDRSREYLEHLFNVVEFGRANLFRDMLDHHKLRQFAGIPDSLLSEEQELKMQLADFNQAILDDPTNADAASDLFETKEKYNRFIDRLEEEHPRYHQLKYRTSLADIETIQKEILSNDITVIEYMADDTAYYGIVISKDNLDARYLGNAKRINRQVATWTKAIIALNSAILLESGQKLYSTLIEPFEENILAEKLILVPHGPLYHLSFEALNKKPDFNSCLIHDYEISYALSLNTLYEQINNTDVSHKRPVIIAPGFESSLKESYINQLGEHDFVDSSYLMAVRQPWSRKMANTIAKKFNGSALLDQNAYEKMVKSQIEDRSIIHFATHAIADHQDPLRSKFILAKNPQDKENDGYLHAYEIYNLSLRSELAVLTACESGGGKNLDGEGMISLAYSMNYAGCPSVVMSLWKIDEKVNNLIVFDFYKNLKAGTDKSAALRAAKLKYLEGESPSMQHPFYWSGMVVMGDPGPTTLSGSNFRVWKWLLIFIGFFLFALLASWYLDK